MSVLFGSIATVAPNAPRAPFFLPAIAHEIFSVEKIHELNDTEGAELLWSR
jgi:hypothetical protein